MCTLQVSYEPPCQATHFVSRGVHAPVGHLLPYPTCIERVWKSNYEVHPCSLDRDLPDMDAKVR